MLPYPVTVYRSWQTVSQYTDTGHGTLPCHSIQIQVMTPCITVYIHRAWHPTLSQYTDYDTLYHSIQVMTPCITVYRPRAWHPVSQYTDTGHGTLPCHSIQIQVMTPCITVYRHRAWHPVSQFTDTGHDSLPSHSIDHDTLYHSIQTQGMAPYPVTIYRYRS